MEHLNSYQFRTHPIGDDPSFPESIPNTWRTDIIRVGPVRNLDYPQGGRRVGSLSWEAGDGPSGEILDVEVGSDLRRQGLATAALRHSQAVAEASKGRIPVPRHSDMLTPDGAAWSRATK